MYAYQIEFFYPLLYTHTLIQQSARTHACTLTRICTSYACCSIKSFCCRCCCVLHLNSTAIQCSRILPNRHTTKLKKHHIVYLFPYDSVGDSFTVLPFVTSNSFIGCTISWRYFVSPLVRFAYRIYIIGILANNSVQWPIHVLSTRYSIILPCNSLKYNVWAELVRLIFSRWADE